MNAVFVLLLVLVELKDLDLLMPYVRLVVRFLARIFLNDNNYLPANMMVRAIWDFSGNEPFAGLAE